MLHWFYYITFFFQAEDGIRDLTVTGVQTCALPIFEQTGVDLDLAARLGAVAVGGAQARPFGADRPDASAAAEQRAEPIDGRSEERRVGKECRSRGLPDQLKKNRASRTHNGNNMSTR